ncbi:hypothetical protein BDV19DRAFT_390828 [Aspergillus venezuelensis]
MPKIDHSSSEIEIAMGSCRILQRLTLRHSPTDEHLHRIGTLPSTLIQSTTQVLASTPTPSSATPVGVKRKREEEATPAKRQRPLKTKRFQYRKRGVVMPISKTQRNGEQVFLKSCYNCKVHANRVTWPINAKITIEPCILRCPYCEEESTPDLRQKKIQSCEKGLRTYITAWKSHMHKYHAKTSLLVTDDDSSEDEEAEDTDDKDPENFVN